MKKSIYILLGLALAALTSCTEVIDVDVPDSAERLMVEGVISTETDSSYVRLTKSVSYFATQDIPKVTDATVEVNGIVFPHVSNGVYAPPAPFTGQVNTQYNLKVTYQGKVYTSTSKLDPMFPIDTIIPVKKEKIGFIDEGYTVTMKYTENRAPVKYTYFRFGFKGIKSMDRDSMFDQIVLFDNKNSKINEKLEFEIPFLRLKVGDSALLVFRSVDHDVSNFFMAVDNSGQGGPFGTPPANLPTNVKGGALGLFAAYDVKRYRVRISEQ